MFENSSLPREMRVSPWESSGQRAFANSLAGTVLHTPNSTVTHACVDVRCPHPRLPCGGKALPRSADAAADVGATRQTLRWCQRALAVPYSDAGIAGAPAAAYGAVRGGAPQRC